MYFKTLLTIVSVFCCVQAQAFLNFSHQLSPKAERAKNLIEGIEQKIERVLEEYDVPGLAIGVVVDGHTILLKGYGHRDVEEMLTVTPDTIFGIGSCTKSFATFAIATLIADGLMEWDQPVCDALPEFRLSDQYASQNVTFRDIALHRSGMARHGYTWYNSQATRADLLKRLRYLEPACEIRERYVYGDLMYMIAGIAVERIAGKPWEEVIAEKILQPLEMKRTNFSVKDSKKDRDRATPYIEKRGKLRKMSFRDFSIIGAGGAMNSTAKDLSNWVKMLLAQGTYSEKKLISPAALQEIFAGQFVVSGLTESQDTLINSYGLGWGIQSYRGHYHVSHDGGVDGFTSLVGLLPNEGIGVVILTNKNLTSLPRLLELEILDRLLELPPRDWLKLGVEKMQNRKQAELDSQDADDVQRKTGTTPSHQLEDYAGEYDHPGYGRVTVQIKDGKLHAEYNGIVSILEHWHYDVFSVVEESEDILVSRVGMKYTFRNHLNGDVEELLIPFEPKTCDIVFKKISNNRESELAYFRQFTGTYQIYGYHVEVAIRDGALIGIIPGQPIYELLPLAKNEFAVRNMVGYSIQFVKNEKGEVVETRLVLPYGAYTASKIR